MAYSPDQLCAPDAATTAAELASIGWLAGEDSPAPLAYLDPIEDAADRDPDESPRGVAIYRHPEALLRDAPELHAIVDRFRCGTRRELGHGEYERWSNFAIEAWRTMIAAEHRERARQIKASHEAAQNG